MKLHTVDELQGNSVRLIENCVLCTVHSPSERVLFGETGSRTVATILVLLLLLLSILFKDRLIMDSLVPVVADRLFLDF